jgi:hypothetical protein
LLLVVPAASPAALQAAESAGISLLVIDERHNPPVRGHVVLPHHVVTLPATRPGSEAAGPAPIRPGPHPWGSLAVIRQLLAGTAATQSELARRAAVSQPRVSQTLAGLDDAALVRRTGVAGHSRWVVADWDALADWWLTRYPGPGGITTYWYALTSVPKQARAAVTELHRAGALAAVSGDPAADVLAPWHRPTRAVVYAQASDTSDPIDLEEPGLTPAGTEEATLELSVPADHGVWASPDPRGTDASLPLADGMQVLWDLARSPSSDTDQAVAALRPVLRARAAAAAKSARE